MIHRLVQAPEPPLNLAEVILYVEDDLTRRVLEEVWGSESRQVRVEVGGSNDGVRHFVTRAQAGSVRVRGLIDRDFGATNRPNWRTAPLPVLDVHEFENLLLDEDAWEAFGVIDFLDQARAEASKQIYWLAARRVLADLQHQLTSQFPSVPSIDSVKSEGHAVEAVVTAGSACWKSAENATKLGRSKTSVAQLVSAEVVRFQMELNSPTNDWRASCSGKEVFKYLKRLLPAYVNSKHDADVAVRLAQKSGPWLRERATALLEAIRP